MMEEQLGKPLRETLACMQTRIMHGTHYFGIETLKQPLDFWVYMEIIHETSPDVIVEIGNWHGGSALALAHTCDAHDHGVVIGVDISHKKVPNNVRDHGRITLFEGDAVTMFGPVSRRIDRIAVLSGQRPRVMIIEDSAHTYDNTLAVLRTYSPLVDPGMYFIVEDSISHHGLALGASPGPYEALEDFVSENKDFEVDRDRENFGVTWNPKGYLRRKS
jgi:cephalosporin hydroxylase